MATEGTNPDGSVRTRLDQLPRVALLAGWATPNVPNGGRIRKSQPPGSKRQMSLETQALLTAMPLAGWATPTAGGSAGEISEDLERRGMKWVNRKTGRVLQTNLATDVKMLVPPQDSGETSNSSPAGTEKLGGLNPDHSRWLMGFPVEWLFAAPTNNPVPRAKKRASTGTTARVRSGASATPSSRP